MLMDFLKMDFRFTDCLGYGRLLKWREEPEVYEQIYEASEAYLTETYWQYVQYDEVVFTDPEDFSPRKVTVADEVLFIPKESASDPVFLTDLLRDMGLLEADSEYDLEIYMNDILIRTKCGYPVGHLERWRVQDKAPEDETEE